MHLLWRNSFADRKVQMQVQCFQSKCGTHRMRGAEKYYTCVITANKNSSSSFTSVDSFINFFFMFLHKCFVWSIFRPPFEKLVISQLLQLNVL